MPKMAFDETACRNLPWAMQHEWLCTNGLGGYASGTVAGVNTRKYHGYLVTALRPPVERYVLLARVEDRLRIGPNEFPLATNEFPGVLDPTGYRYLIRFELRAGPVWRYACGPTVLEKSICLVHGQDAVIVRYELLQTPAAADRPPVRLYVQPMLAGRYFHRTSNADSRPDWRLEPAADPVAPLVLRVPQVPRPLYLNHNADRFTPGACWWYNYIYRQETARGYPDHDDLWTPGTLEFILRPGQTVGFIGATAPLPWAQHAALVLKEQARQDELARHIGGAAPARATGSATLAVPDTTGLNQRTAVEAQSDSPAGSAPPKPSSGDPDPHGYSPSAPLPADEISGSDNGHHQGRAMDFISRLTLAADQFVVRRLAARPGRDRMSIIAGYPWFEDWGRDSLISLAGLTLVTGHYATARNVLVTFAENIRDGLVPNRFPDAAEEPDYNTVDASLWFIHAAYQYWRYTDDIGLLRDYLYPPLCQIIEHYRLGTRYGIRMQPDALIRAGEPGVQLTWMDAKIGDEVITPRYGKPVEINALWYNALRIMAQVAGRAGDRARAASYTALADQAGVNFSAQFWNPAAGCLFDVLADDGTADARIRPNQILAVSLPFSPLSPPRAEQVVAAVEKELLTPWGLRTLAPSAPQYQGRYQGDQNARDRAYHQGTVWPWLIGPFISALVKIGGGSLEARRRAWAVIEPFEGHLSEGALGSLSEIADGDAPQQPRGCIAQAWSVAEVLRCCWEDVLNHAPPWPHERGPVKP